MKVSVTAKDVAKACNVSQATVSYVINNRPDKQISHQTRQLILETAKKLNYYPNISARNVRLKSTTSIGLVCASQYSKRGFFEAVSGIKEHFDANNYTITLYGDQRGAEVPDYVKSYYSNVIDGVIFVCFGYDTTLIKAAVDNDIPFVVISENGVWTKDSPMPHAYQEAVDASIAFCKENGLNRIRYFTTREDGELFENKYRLIVDAIKRIFPESDFERFICEVPKRTPEYINPIMQQYIDNNDFDIAICPNHDTGLSVQKAILNHGYTVPQWRKNIIMTSGGFFNSIYPSITGFNIPLFDMGVYASELLLSKLIPTISPPAPKNFECEVIHRQSTQLQ